MDVTTLLGIRTLAHRRLGRGSTVSATSAFTAECDDAANEALEMVYTDGDWPWKRAVATITTVANQAYVACPASFGAMDAVRIPLTDSTNFLEVVRNSLEFDDTLYDYAGETGEPTAAMIRWNEDLDTPAYCIYFAPIPDAAYAYSLPFRRKAPTLGAVGTTLNAASKAAICEVGTTTAHGLSDGERVYIADAGGMTQLNGNSYFVDVQTSTTFKLYTDKALTSAVNSTAYTTYTSGGTASRIWPYIPPHWVPAWQWRTLEILALGSLGRESADRFYDLSRQAWRAAQDREASIPWAGPAGTLLANLEPLLGGSGALLTEWPY